MDLFNFHNFSLRTGELKTHLFFKGSELSLGIFPNVNSSQIKTRWQKVKK